ncbi:DUF1684 domain-containing protein [Polaribacter sp.]|nr:DUF1684 domain-containing protein [Polaribacter sp.]
MRFFSFLICSLIFFTSCNSQDKRAIPGATDYQKKLNLMYMDASKSPLKKRDLKNFTGLHFFPIDTTFIVNATFVETENAPVIKMPTTTDRKPLYKEYGKLQFTLKGSNCELTVYQSQDEARDEKYKDNLFLPFTDDTSGNESYGGGRYMDLKIYDIKNNSVVLNFNNTYNPYCAYNDNYSCPLVPRKNHLDLEIKAGVKKFDKH